MRAVLRGRGEQCFARQEQHLGRLVCHCGDHHGRAGDAGVRFSEYRTGRNVIEQRLVAPCVAALDIHAAREQNAQRMRGIADTVNRLKFIEFTRAGVQTA